MFHGNEGNSIQLVDSSSLDLASLDSPSSPAKDGSLARCTARLKLKLSTGILRACRIHNELRFQSKEEAT